MTTGVEKRSAYMHWLHLQCFLRMRSHISKRLEFPGYRKSEVIHRYVGGHVFRGELGGTGHCGGFLWLSGESHWRPPKDHRIHHRERVLTEGTQDSFQPKIISHHIHFLFYFTFGTDYTKSSFL